MNHTQLWIKPTQLWCTLWSLSLDYQDNWIEPSQFCHRIRTEMDTEMKWTERSYTL